MQTKRNADLQLESCKSGIIEPFMNRILIVDDHDDSAKTFSIILSQDFACHSAHSRDEALKAILSGLRPSCIVADYSMPGMSLLTFLEKIAPYHIPVVLTSALFDADALAKGFGLRHFLPKSASPDEVVSVVRRAIESGEHAAVKG